MKEDLNSLLKMAGMLDEDGIISKKKPTGKSILSNMIKMRLGISTEQMYFAIGGSSIASLVLGIYFLKSGWFMPLAFFINFGLLFWFGALE